MVLCETLTAITPLFLVLGCGPVTPPPNHDPLCENSDGYLNMTNRGLQRIGKDFLRNSSYTCIDLSGNNITDVEEGALASMTELTYLNLSGNKLSPEFLTTYSHPKVRVLVLDEAFAEADLPEDIKYSPTILSTFPELRRLYLRRNNFERLIVPSWRESFPRIRHIYLDDNRLQSASFLTVLPKNLTHLSLSNNRLSSFKTGSLEHLEGLNLDNNQFSKLCESEACDEGIYLNGAINLKVLSLSNNNLSTLNGGAMKNLGKLKYLNLSDNALSEIPHLAFQNLRSLFDLNLSNNGLRKVPDLCNLRNLKFLNLSHNVLLHSIDRDTFCDLPNLDHIDLTHNGIPQVSPEVFIGMITGRTPFVEKA